MHPQACGSQAQGGDRGDAANRGFSDGVVGARRKGRRSGKARAATARGAVTQGRRARRGTDWEPGQ